MALKKKRNFSSILQFFLSDVDFIIIKQFFLTYTNNNDLKLILKKKTETLKILES